VNGTNSIKVLVIDDSVLMQRIAVTGITADPMIQVVGTAGDPYEARDKILALDPDVLVLDINMPKMNGIEFLKKLIPQYSIPVVVISAQTSSKADAINAGAFDFVEKKGTYGSDEINNFIRRLISKIKLAASSRNVYLCISDPLWEKKRRKIIAIGASTGGTVATTNLLKGLDDDLPGILIVQHMPSGFTKKYAQNLDISTSLKVKEAEDGDAVLPGHVLVAPGDYHMKIVSVNGIYKVNVFKGEKVNTHCPSIDVLFNSVAEVCRYNALGIILTGMGDDGARGLLHMRENGAFTIGQDEASSVIYGMPMVAEKIGAVCEQHSLSDIAKHIYKWYDKQ